MRCFLPTVPPHRWLEPPLALERDQHHRYRLGDQTFPISVTGVLAAGKPAQTLETFEHTRHEWEPRGTTVHLALELAATVPGWHPDHWPPGWRFADWIWPLLEHPIWQEVQLCASELMLASTALGVAGTFDGAWLCRGKRTLFDLKTQARADAGAYCTRAQLGGYLTLAAEHGITFDQCATLWSRPGKASLTLYDPAECLEAWSTAWEHWSALQAILGPCRANGWLVDAADPF